MAKLSRIEELFHLAVKDASAAESVLRSECSGDEGLLRSVLELLRVHSEGASAIIDRPMSEFAEFAVAAEFGPSVSEDNVRQLQAGDVLLNYQIVRRLGEGGMGTAFLAKELHPIQRLVAIKMLKSGSDDSQAVHRFAVERQVLAAFRHPSIPTILNAGTTSCGCEFLALEFIDGMAISTYCREQKVNVNERVRLFAELCRTVGYVHDRGFIHRDIKSANVLVAVHGGVVSVHLIDFGIARVVNDVADALKGDTGTGQVLGTPGCMSPEQFLPGSARVDHRSDIYSLGLLLYKLLTNTSPLELASEDSASKLAALQHPKPPSEVSQLQIDRHMATEIDSIILKCLRVSPDQRYQAIPELLKDLDYVLDDASKRAENSFNRRASAGLRRIQRLVSTIACAAMFLFLPASDMTTPSTVTEALLAENDFSKNVGSSNVVKVDSETFEHITRILSNKGITTAALEDSFQIQAIAGSDLPNDQQVVTLLPDFVPADAI